MVFQDYALFPHLDVARNVGFGLGRRSEAEMRKRVSEVLELVGLSGLEARFPNELSGGQQQRVALARALAPAPELILLDEPFSNLDAALRSRVRADVHEILQRAHSTAIFVTHDQDEALSLSDQVAVMDRGRVLQVGTPEDLYRRPSGLEVARLLGEVNVLPAEAANGLATCELGQLPIDNHQLRGPVEVLLRPEAICLELASDAAPDSAEVVRREFFGHDQRLGVRLPSGRQLTTRMGADPAFRPGTRVHVRVLGPTVAFRSA
jgi:iron(III) transport system ATP-binding protein